MNICVYGAASDKIAPVFIDEAEKLGREMVKRGYGLVYGGGATGLMGAVARGVKSQNGYIHGVAPKYFDNPGVLYGDCTDFTFTETIRERKQIMEDEAVAFIMTPGGIGTFEEFFEMLTLSNLGRTKKPIAIFNVAGYFDKIVEVIDNAVEQGFVDTTVYDTFNVFTDTEEMLDYITSRR